MTSWMVLSCAAVNVPWPMRLAGTWKQYSAKTISQLTRMASMSGVFLYFKCPYHAKVIKMLEIIRKIMVVTRNLFWLNAYFRKYLISKRPSSILM